MPPFCETHQRYHVANPDRRNCGAFTICPDCKLGLPPAAPASRTETNTQASE